MFTEYAATLDWIVRHPGPARLPGRHRLAVIQGSTPAEERETDPRPVHRDRRTSSRSGSWSRPTPPARASTCRTTATGWSTSTSRSTRPGWSSGSAGSTATARSTRRRSSSFAPARSDFGVRAGRAVPGRQIARRSAASPPTSARSTRSSTREIQDHFTPGGTAPQGRSWPRRDDGNVIINRALAGGMELNRAAHRAVAHLRRAQGRDAPDARRTRAGSWTPRWR